MRPIIRLVRPEHWVKNVLVLFPVVFAMRMGDAGAWLNAGLAAVAFCLAASAVYAFNDIRDRQSDRLHPRKRLRPVASGQVSVATAAGVSLVLALGGLAVGFGVGTLVGAVVAAYLLLQAVYSLWLKGKMLVDVICVAMGFVLRAAGGAVAIHVAASPWLIVCTFTLCLFMGFCKRRCEVSALEGELRPADHRATLAGYTPELLTHLTTLSAGIAVLSFLLYATSPDTVERFHTICLVYTLPIVIYAVFRFAMLSMSGKYDDPMELILRDRPFQVTVAIWGAAVLAAILWGKDMQAWIAGHH
jgi:4-hydroxybenzoate polyprenyltransferase